MRPKKGREFWDHTKQFVIFYDAKTDFPVEMFDNIQQIVKYRKLENNKVNYDLTLLELYRALKRDNHYTEMLGRPMTVYLIDEIEENMEEEK